MKNIVSRRSFIQSMCAVSLSLLAGRLPAKSQSGQSGPKALAPLQEYGYGDIQFFPSLPQKQFEETIATLLAISDDDMLKPFRSRAGMPAPGAGLGGWYDNNPDYDFKKGDAPGFAPGHCFGQWMSALARAYAINKSPDVHAKLERLVRGYGETISPKFYEDFRFPAYTYDKLVCGLTDAYQLAGIKEALPLLDRTTDAAMPNLPDTALERLLPVPKHPDRDESFRWDESYTMPENLFRAYEAGAGERYKQLAERFLMDKTLFDPLAAGEDALAGKHAYSYVNSLSSAMKAYLVTGNSKYLRASENAWNAIQVQSYATAGWGPDEVLLKRGDSLAPSLVSTHQSFELCGAYAHMKLTRYLLRVKHDSTYGDSMESIIYNAALGALPLKPDGDAFYYSDYNYDGHKYYFKWKVPCCAGTLPQIVADYRLCTYLKDKDGPIVNLYIPSKLTWTKDGATLSLTQETDYPFDGRVKIKVGASQPTKFSLTLRVPAYVACVAINGKDSAGEVFRQYRASGMGPRPSDRYWTMSRNELWKDGDVVELDFPLSTRLEPLDAKHPNLVSLFYGPLVLFGLTNGKKVKVTKEQLLAAKRDSNRKDVWIVESQAGPITFMPFTSIKDEHYCTYFEV